MEPTKGQAKQTKTYWACVDKATGRYLSSGCTLKKIDTVKCIQSLYLLDDKSEAELTCIVRGRGGRMECDSAAYLIPKKITFNITYDFELTDN